MSAARTELRAELTHLVPDARSRELAVRAGDCLRVQLLWNPITDAVTVELEDLRAGNGLHLAVERERALDPYYHPFAFAA